MILPNIFFFIYKILISRFFGFHNKCHVTSDAVKCLRRKD